MGGELPSQEFLQSMVSQIATTAASVTGAVPTAGTDVADTGGIINLLTCPIGSDCYKTKHNTYLLNKLNLAQVNTTNAPIDLSRAEKNYYVYNEGNGNGDISYNLFIQSRFNTTAAEFKQNSIDRQQQFMADLSQSLKQYQAQATFQAQAAKLLIMRQNEQNDLIKNINYYQKIVATSERKVVFENKNMDSLYTYRRIMIFIYYACIVCFILFANFIPDRLYTKYSVWLLIVIVSIVPIILNIAIIWLFLIFDTLSYWFEDLPYKDVYKNLETSGGGGMPPSKPLSSASPTKAPTQAPIPAPTPAPSQAAAPTPAASPVAPVPTESPSAVALTSFISKMPNAPTISPATLSSMSDMLPPGMAKMIYNNATNT
jgi:hypothetical protein